MNYDDEQTEFVPVELSNGAKIKIEVAQTGREDVAFSLPSFKTVTDTIEGIAGDLKETLDRVKPDKASVKIGLDMSVESNMVTAMLVKGAGRGNLEITLEWGK